MPFIIIDFGQVSTYGTCSLAIAAKPSREGSGLLSDELAPEQTLLHLRPIQTHFADAVITNVSPDGTG